jgi:hypothetical protein
VLSLLVAFAAFLAVHRLAFAVTGRGVVALVITAFVALHPYNIGLSVFVFNDMTAVLFVVLGLAAAAGRRPAWAGAAFACALLSRQYMAFAVLAVGAWSAVRWWRFRDGGDLRRAAAAAVSFVPLAALMWFWGGVGPDNDARVDYLRHGLAFKMPGLMLYLALLCVYLAPLLFWSRLPRRTSALVAGLAVLASYPLWPVVAADAQRAANIATAGFLHRALRATGSPLIEHAVWALSAACGAAVAASLVVWSGRALRDPARDRDGLLAWPVIAFLLVMPFSYMYWEKYFMPVLPIAALAIVRMRSDEAAPPPGGTP